MSFDLDTTGWHKWFAIYPVYLNCGKLTWLKTVYRNGTVYDFLDEVSYDKHFWYLLTFRDPMVLYPQRIQDLMK